MSGAERLRELLNRGELLTVPGCSDALGATLIEQSGFEAVYMTGFGSSATLLGQPDVGLLTGSEGLLAVVTGAVAAMAADRQRSRAGLLQLAVLLPAGAVLLQWLLLQGRGLPGQIDLVGEGLMLAGLLMLGLLMAPLVETSFGLVTKARLLELALELEEAVPWPRIQA